jgi:hypothetical protein
MIGVDVLDRNRAVLDLVASDHVLEILHGRVTQRGWGLAVSASLICLFVKPSLFSETVLTKVKLRVMDRNTRPLGCIRIPYSACSPTLGQQTSNRCYRM